MTMSLLALRDDLMGQLDAAAATTGRSYSEVLLPPAAVERIDDVARTMDRSVPSEVRDLYLWHDGSASEFIPFCAFHTLTQALGGRDNILSFPVPPASNASPDPKPGDLLPIFSTDGADYCAQLGAAGAPAPKTTAIYYVDLAAESIIQMAVSLDAFIRHVIARLDDPGVRTRPFGLEWIEADWLVFPAPHMVPWD
jgi:hypothetical protein